MVRVKYKKLLNYNMNREHAKDLARDQNKILYAPSRNSFYRIVTTKPINLMTTYALQKWNQHKKIFEDEVVGHDIKLPDIEWNLAVEVQIKDKSLKKLTGFLKEKLVEKLKSKTNIFIRVNPEISECVQKICFENGVTWADNSSKVINTDRRVLSICNAWDKNRYVIRSCTDVPTLLAAIADIRWYNEDFVIQEIELSQKESEMPIKGSSKKAHIDEEKDKKAKEVMEKNGVVSDQFATQFSVQMTGTEWQEWQKFKKFAKIHGIFGKEM